MTKRLPRESRWPVLGALPDVVRGQLDFLEEAHRRHGEIFELDLGLTSAVIVASPALAEDVLVTKARNYDKGGDFWDTLRKSLGSGLPVSEGDLWRRQRRLMTPAFRGNTLSEFVAVIRQVIAEHLEELANQSRPIDIESWAYRVTATLTIRLLLGWAVTAAEVDQLRPSMAAIFDYALRGIVLNRLPGWCPKPGERDFVAARKVVDETVYSLIDARRASGESTEKIDLLGRLVAAADRDEGHEGQMTDKQIRDEVVSLYVGGYETTGSTLALTLWLMARHPHILTKLQQQIDAAEGSVDIPLLEACVRESLRLYPAGPLIPRRAVADDTLGEFSIASGSQVLVAPWLIHRNEADWPSPSEFRPERFLDPAGNLLVTKKQHRLAWCPFGAGQRLCIGKELAMMELRHSLAMVLSRFNVAEEPSLPSPRLRLLTTIHSEAGIYLSLRQRSAKS